MCNVHAGHESSLGPEDGALQRRAGRAHSGLRSAGGGASCACAGSPSSAPAAPSTPSAARSPPPPSAHNNAVTNVLLTATQRKSRLAYRMPTYSFIDITSIFLYPSCALLKTNNMTDV